MLNFNDCATLLASINQQATGQVGLTPTNASEFVSVATTTLATGYDKVIGAISQVLSKTIFSTRPYNRKFAGLNATNIRYGNHVRKLSMVDSDPETDQRHTVEHGKSVDMQKVNKPGVVQTNFYGANVYERHITIFKDQLDCAFSSAEEFGAFIAMIVQHVSDEIEKDHENCARFTLANFVGGKIKCDGGNVVHLLTEYNARCPASGPSGSALTIENVYKPENFSNFIKFAMARIKTVSELMTERTVKYHVNLEGKPIARHTPLDKQKMYIYGPAMNDVETNVLSSVFHDEYLKKVDFETVNYWQSIETPTDINMTVSYMGTDGAIVSAEVEQSDIFGVLFDEEALGYTVVNTWSAAAPFNAAGGYTNVYHHFTDRYWNDFTENGVVFVLD